MTIRKVWLNAILLAVLVVPGVRPLGLAAQKHTVNVPAASLSRESNPPSTASAAMRLGETIEDGPLMFIENIGQFAEGARFQAAGSNGTLWLTEDALWITVLEPSSVSDGSSSPLAYEPGLGFDQRTESEGEDRRGVSLRLSFPESNPNVLLEPFNRLETSISYYIGDDPNGWRPDVPVWGGVRFVNLYPGIDLELTSDGDRLVQRVRARPGADLAQVRLRVEGADAVDLDGVGGLRLRTPVGDTTVPLLTFAHAAPDTQPVVFAREAEAFEVAWPLAPPSRPEPILQTAAQGQDDSSHLAYSTFLGGSNSERGRGIAVDEAGNTYVMGRNDFGEFPATPGAFDTTFNGVYDIFVAKLNAAGSDLVYATFLGGSNFDYGQRIAVDDAGNAYVTGYTSSSDFPATTGAFNTTPNGSLDAFVAKLNPTGSDLVYSTFLGGSDRDEAYDIAVANDGNAYVIGLTYSSDFPTTPGVIDTTFNGGLWDAFVAKLNSTGSDLVYSTFLGGDSYDSGRGIAVGNEGSAYVAGETQSPGFPVTTGTYDTTLNGSLDVFVAKVNPTGTDLTYSTFLGGGSGDYGRDIAVDDAGNAYVTGRTDSSDFPATPGAFDTTFNGAYVDAFVAKLNPTASDLAYSTFLGGSSSDDGQGIAVDGLGYAYVAGYTSSSDFPATLGAFDTAFNGAYVDAFAAKLNPTGSDLAYATFLGGSSDDHGVGIAVDRGYAHVTGYTESPDFPATADAFDTICGGSRDAFVAKLDTRGEPVTGTVVVQHKDGTPVDRAQVFHNETLVGTTASDGSLEIPDLMNSDLLVARLRVHEDPSPKQHHDQDSTQNWAYRVYITSMEILETGVAQSHMVDNPSMTQTLTLKNQNPLIGFNIVASVEWDANTAYLDDLEGGMEFASQYLYNASNGQMLFERVTIYENSQFMDDADYQIRASNQEWPRAHVGGLLESGDLHVFLGRHFGRSATGVGSSMSGSWTLPAGYAAMTHEFGHYGLYLHDSYLDADRQPKAHCTSADIRQNGTANVNATLMYLEFFATQFAMRDVTGLWSSECEQTYQVFKNNGQSDWETIVDRYSTRIGSAQLKTPADYGAVVPGPTSLPVGIWTDVTIGSDADTGVCEPPPIYLVERDSSPVANASIYLRKDLFRTIYQGKTDDQGKITVLGAADGDRIIVNNWGINLGYNSETVSCPSMSVAFASDVGTIMLEPAAFDLTASIHPGDLQYQAQVRVGASAALSSVPKAYLTQREANTAVPVELAYDDSLQAYTGVLTLSTDLTPSGVLGVLARDIEQREVEIVVPFNLEAAIRTDDNVIYSPDGQAELYIPVYAISGSGTIAIEPGQIVTRLPDRLHLLSGPYTMHAAPGLTLDTDATLSLRYPDLGDLNRFNTRTAQIHRWDDSEWIPLETTVGEDHQIASAMVTDFGTYALLAEKLEAVYLPIVLRQP